MFETISEMLSLGFINRAIIVGVLVSLCAALLGVSLVLKRYSNIGDRTFSCWLWNNDCCCRFRRNFNTSNCNSSSNYRSNFIIKNRK